MRVIVEVLFDDGGESFSDDMELRLVDQVAEAYDFFVFGEEPWVECYHSLHSWIVLTYF